MIRLSIDGVMVCQASAQTRLGHVDVRVRGPESVSIRPQEWAVRKPRAFVVMQFGDEFDALYTDVIGPTCVEFGFDVIRADDIYLPGLILADIVRSINDAQLIIADITTDNPNVFYEVGYAHGIGKPTILMSDRRREKLPFDVSGMRTLFYDNTIGGKSQVEQKLGRHLEAIVGGSR